MARITKPLSDNQIKNAAPGNYFDGQGLYIEVTAKGKKFWRIKYKYQGKDKRKSLGGYPIVTLKAARKKRELVLTALEDGLDPFALEAESANTFDYYCKEFMKHNTHLSDKHLKRIQFGWDSYVPKSIKSKPMDEITAGDIVKILHVLRDKGTIDSGIKLFSSINQLFSWSISNNPDVITMNPCGGLSMKHVLGEQKVKSYASISENEPEKLGKILKSLEAYTGFDAARRAVQFIIHTAVRPSNVQFAEWKEIDLENKTWTISAEKMKSRKEHIVPLSFQMIEALKEWRGISESPYLFQGRDSVNSAISSSAMIRVLKGIDSGLVSHSFRSVFSTFAHTHKKDYHEEIEMQLSHSIGTAVSNIYNRAQQMERRIELMQWWSDYLGKLKTKEDS